MALELVSQALYDEVARNVQLMKGVKYHDRSTLWWRWQKCIVNKGIQSHDRSTWQKHFFLEPQTDKLKQSEYNMHIAGTHFLNLTISGDVGREGEWQGLMWRKYVENHCCTDPHRPLTGKCYDNCFPADQHTTSLQLSERATGGQRMSLTLAYRDKSTLDNEVYHMFRLKHTHTH